MAKAKPAPSWLSKDAKAEWKRVYPVLAERGVLTDADMGALETYCATMGRVRQLEKLCAEVDPFVQSETSAPRPHPAFRMLDDAITQARQWAMQLGLTPASRAKAAREDADDDDGWAGLVDG
ncbi:phage terminase small subunit P27 family [Oceanicaulis alexandrii]|uniref:phage terminase small subunit P27 family n=1 Tax=Oceanicaulis alexandrii TaxID=153233 RepID=UPI003B505630|tara:strand:+ start:468 stop:833 length:366 start_codon:yes stop_codon:yes gene_type:complete